MMNESLYFIAIIPPEEIQEQITELKQEMAVKYGSAHALKSPPHITLHMPFKWKDTKLPLLYQTIQNFNDNIIPFQVELSGFDFFEPRVVFVAVKENDELNQLQRKVMEDCRKVLKLTNANYKDRAFHPHVTIGFRDLKKKQFYEARKEFESRDFKKFFHVDKLQLLKHNGANWQVLTIPS